MAGITLINEDLLLPFTEETPVHANFMNPIIDNVNKNTSAIGQIRNEAFMQKGVINDNLDNIIDPGNYLCSSTCINLPATGNGNLKVFRPIPDNLNHTTQIIDMFSGTTALGTFIRNKFGGTWTVWKEMADGLNTPIVRNIPDGVTLIKDLPMGIYRIFNGAASFTDYPILAKNLGHNYGILEVRQIIGGYRTHSLIVGDGSVTHSAQYTGFSAGGAVRWNGLIPYNLTAPAGITIVANGSYIRDGIVYVYLAIRKTDGTDFPAGTQVSAALLDALNITYPKVVSFTCWDFAGNVLRGSGGSGTVFVNKYVLVVPAVASGLLRIAGSFTME